MRITANNGMKAMMHGRKSPVVLNIKQWGRHIALQRNSADKEESAPKVFTACVSDISCSPQEEPRNRAAFKAFAEIYADYQAYLAPSPLEHDYDASMAADVMHWGCLSGETLASFSENKTAVSEDAIEDCGYLGWLSRAP